MPDINLPKDVVRKAEERWARSLMREAGQWKARATKPAEIRTALSRLGRAVPVEARRKPGSMAIA